MEHIPDWDPRSAEVLTDQVAAYDQLRARGYRPGDDIQPPPGGCGGGGS